MMLVSAVLLGTAFLDDIRIVSHLSLANAVSHLVINAIMVIYCFSQVKPLHFSNKKEYANKSPHFQIGNWELSSVIIFPNIRLLPTMVGVVVFGYTSHIFLPSLEASMEVSLMTFTWQVFSRFSR